MTNAELADKYTRDGWIDITNVDDPKEWQQIIAALRHPSSDKVLVPREPTPKMLEAGAMEAIGDSFLIHDERQLERIWTEMLAAAEGDQ